MKNLSKKLLGCLLAVALLVTSIVTVSAANPTGILTINGSDELATSTTATVDVTITGDATEGFAAAYSELDFGVLAERITSVALSHVDFDGVEENGVTVIYPQRADDSVAPDSTKSPYNVASGSTENTVLPAISEGKVKFIVLTNEFVKSATITFAINIEGLDYTAYPVTNVKTEAATDGTASLGEGVTNTEQLLALTVDGNGQVNYQEPVVEPEPEPTTIKLNSVSYELVDAFDLNVYATSDAAHDEVKLLVFKSEPTDPDIADAAAVVEAKADKDSKGRWVFSYRGIAAKQLGEWLFLVGYTNVDGVEYYSAPSKYSFARYARAKYEGNDENLANLARAALNYGAAAQVAFGHDGIPCNTPMCKVTVTGGTITQLSKATAYFLAGEEFTITAPATNEDGLAFASWTGSDGSSYTDATVAVSVNADVTFTANYQ